jgi:hypothetical protein
MKTDKLSQVKARETTIINTLHPEWGTWGVYEDNGEWLEIHGDRGGRVLFYDEFEKYWEIV